MLFKVSSMNKCILSSNKNTHDNKENSHHPGTFSHQSPLSGDNQCFDFNHRRLALPFLNFL